MDVLNEHWGMSLARPNGCSAVQDVLPHLNALLSDRILSQLLSIVVTTWLVAGLEHFLFFHILVIVTITDFHIFQRGWNHQPDDFYFELFFFEHMVRDSSPSFFWNCGISNNFLILPGDPCSLTHSRAQSSEKMLRTPGVRQSLAEILERQPWRWLMKQGLPTSGSGLSVMRIHELGNRQELKAWASRHSLLMLCWYSFQEVLQLREHLHRLFG